MNSSYNSTTKINSPIEEWAKDLNRHISSKKIYRWPVGT